MINPQLLQHLSRVKTEQKSDDDRERSRNLLFPRLGRFDSGSSAFLAASIVVSLLTYVYSFDKPNLLAVSPVIVAVLVVSMWNDWIRVCCRSLLEKWNETSRNLSGLRKAQYLQRLSEALGSMGAPMIPSKSMLVEDDAWIASAKPSLEALLNLMSNQSKLMLASNDAIEVLQSCSRFVASARPMCTLPLPLFREQLYQVMHSNREQLERLMQLEVMRDRSASVPSTQNLRAIRLDTLQLFPILCERCLVHHEPGVGKVLAMVLETQQAEAYLTGLVGSLLDGDTATGNCSELLRQSLELQKALVVLNEDFPSSEETVDLWTRALHMSQSVTRRLTELVDQGQPSLEESVTIISDHVAVIQEPGSSEITFQPCNSSAHAALAMDLNEKMAHGNKTMVYRTTVAPRERSRRRRKVLPHSATQSDSPTTPFDFLDELQVRLQSLPPQPEVVENDL